MQAFTLDDVNLTETKHPDTFGVTIESRRPNRTASTGDELILRARAYQSSLLPVIKWVPTTVTYVSFESSQG